MFGYWKRKIVLKKFESILVWGKNSDLIVCVYVVWLLGIQKYFLEEIYKNLAAEFLIGETGM